MRCSAARSRPAIRIYNTCAGYRYIRNRPVQKVDNWGLPAAGANGPYEDLDAFMNRADELALSLLEQGITGMKIWPFDPAAEASGGLYISRPDLERALEPFAKIRRAVGDKMDIMLECHSLWNLPHRDAHRRGAEALRSLLVRGSDQDGQPRLARRVQAADRRAGDRERDAWHPLGLPRPAWSSRRSTW